MFQTIPEWDLGLYVCTGVTEEAMLNLSGGILFNLKWDYFIIYIVHIKVEESHGTFVRGSICFCI